MPPDPPSGSRLQHLRAPPLILPLLRHCLVLKRRQRQLQNRRKHQFWIQKIFMKRQDKLNFSLIFSQLLDFCVCLWNSYYGCKRTDIAQLCSMPAIFQANERCYKRTFWLYGLEPLNHRSELKILWDTFRSQIAELLSSAIVCNHDHDRCESFSTLLAYVTGQNYF